MKSRDGKSQREERVEERKRKCHKKEGTGGRNVMKVAKHCFLDHSWKFRCGKIAGCCGGKCIFKSKC